MKDFAATRDGFGHALVQLGNTEPRLVVLDSDLSRSTRTEWFKDAFPERFINCGIAEQNMIGVAAGLALSGWIPVATTYAIFIGRAFDQIRQAVGFGATNVKIVATHAGLAASHDGGSHQGLEDIALMRVIPGMSIYSPSDYDETVATVKAAIAAPGPTYIRLQKEPRPSGAPQSVVRAADAYVIRPGNDLLILSTGTLTIEALEAASALSAVGIEVTVINVVRIKPLSDELILFFALRCGAVLVVEEHSVIGGLFEAVASLLAERGPMPATSVSVKDEFGTTGDWRELRGHYGLTCANIVSSAHRLIERKTSGRHKSTASYI